MEIVLDGSSIRSEAAFHDAIGEAARDAGFEGYGRNLDALQDVLTGILPLPIDFRWVRIERARGAIGPRFERLVQVLRDAEAELDSAQFRLELEP